MDKKTAANSTYAIGGVSFSADSFVVTGSSVLRMNFCAKKPAHRKSANVSQNVRTTNSKQTLKKLKTANWTISTLVILTNIYFLPFSFVTIKSTGGAFGYGLLILPISLSINLLLITTGLTFKTKFNKSVGLLIINGLVLLWAFFWLWLLLTTPKMD